MKKPRQASDEVYEEISRWRPWTSTPVLLADVSPNSPYQILASPYYWALVEIRRQGSESTDVVEPTALSPEFNVHGLYWRPWPREHPKFDGP
jgi:hypothetical protein